MRQSTAPLISQCPICGRGEIVLRSRKILGYTRRQVQPCPACGATVAPAGAGLFKLDYCAPHKLDYQGCRRCVGYYYNVCFLDRALPLSDWERMARRQPPVEVEEFIDTSRRLESGELLTIEIANLSDQLAPGEVVHHFSHPVFTDDWYLSSKSEDGGNLFVTNRRLLFCAPKACSSLPFEDFEELEEEHPGFYVRLRGEQEPRYFFPPSLDPVFSAVIGALKNFRRAGATPEKQK